ncbi:major facilitator superfamily domain-containing protein [Aspergillus alliaceus]|uniref:major facilitator superfamily domain-containing protein n=1 Tax=Petromyces alliaceus TaxID=209559 RepID=UPI0012A6977D|nr:major facilitator superfamily domain-containing protein [Aspergillus alliaceus]KAB8239234.1 major facilitator superfamily domain-containing protein [Aspergillus alliaceus]
MDYSSDARNPHNWPAWKKIYHTLIPCLLSFLITLSTSVGEPATNIMVVHFSISRTVAILPLTLYTLGLAFGPLFVAPLSEVLGRRWVYIISSSCLLAFAGGAAATQSFATHLICRFFSGFLGSAAIAMGAGTLVDIWALGKHGGIAGLCFILGPFLGPTLGPIIGAYILGDHNNDWRWTQYIVLMIGAPIWLGTILMKETCKASLTRTPGQKLTWNTFTTVLVQFSLVRPLRMLFIEAIVLSLTICTGFAYAVTFSYFESATYVLQLNYGFDMKQVGLEFISVVIGYLLAAFFFGLFDKLFYARTLKAANGEMPAPEHRLYFALMGSILLPAGLFWYAWEAHPGGHWAALIAAGIPFGRGAFSLFLSTITYMSDVYQAGAVASALAANGTFRYSLGATFPLFTLQMYKKLGTHWASSLFAFISLLLFPFPWLLFRYGHVLRAKSHFPASTAGRAKFFG